MFNDLSINFSGLNELLVKLDQDNKNIEQVIKDINVIIRSLDETKWKSREKEKLDIMMLPYINNVESNVFGYLNDCVISLLNAKFKYQKFNSDVNKESSNLII